MSSPEARPGESDRRRGSSLVYPLEAPPRPFLAPAPFLSANTPAVVICYTGCVNPLIQPFNVCSTEVR